MFSLKQAVKHISFLVVSPSNLFSTLTKEPIYSIVIYNSGVLPLIGPLEGAVGGDVLPSGHLTTCRPQEGICFSAINRGEGLETVQVGCWPSQTKITGLAWLGTPKCRLKVNRLICLCQSDLCNSLVPVWPQQQEPQGDEIQGVLFIFIILFITFLVLGAVLHRLSRLCRSQTLEHEIYKQRVTPSPGGNWNHLPPQGDNPPPLLRMHSAPPNLPSDPNQMSPPSNFTLLPPYQVTLDSDNNNVYNVTDHYSLLLGYKRMTRTSDV